MTTSHEVCPICGEGHLSSKIGKNAVEYKGNFTDLDMLFSVCDSCGSEQSDAKQLRANKRAMIAFRKQADGLLTGEQVRNARERLGITQADASRIFGGGPIAFSKYESDDVAQSEAMDKLLRVAVTIQPAFNYLAHTNDAPHNITRAWVNIKTQKTSRSCLQVIATSTLPTKQEWKKSA